MNNNLIICSFCKHSTTNEYFSDSDGHKYACPRCGLIDINGTMLTQLNKFESDFWFISSYSRKQSDNGLDTKIYSSKDIWEIVQESKSLCPQNSIEAQNRLILYIGDNAQLIGSWVKYDEDLDVKLHIQFSELQYLIKSLYELKILELNNYSMNAFVNGNPVLPSEQYNIKLSLKGYEKYERLKTSNYDSKNIFVAMWFSDNTKQLRAAIKGAVEASGFNPIIIDEKHYTGSIMDYVLNSIKISKFAIADFTVIPEYKTEDIEDEKSDEYKIKGGTRGGVYYEAGFAKGLGLKVIHTCKNDHDSKKRLHFDVEQENTIFWNDKDLEDLNVRKITERKDKLSPKNFAEKLYDRIINIL